MEFKPVYDYKETAEYLSISIPTLRKAVAAGQISFIRIGTKRVLFPFKAIEQFLDSAKPLSWKNMTDEPADSKSDLLEQTFNQLQQRILELIKDDPAAIMFASMRAIHLHNVIETAMHGIVLKYMFDQRRKLESIWKDEDDNNGWTMGLQRARGSEDTGHLPPYCLQSSQRRNYPRR